MCQTNGFADKKGDVKELAACSEAYEMVFAFLGSPAIFRVPLPKDPAQPEHEERQTGHPSQLSPEAFHLGVE